MAMARPSSPSNGNSFDAYYREFSALLRQLEEEPQQQPQKPSASSSSTSKSSSHVNNHSKPMTSHDTKESLQKQCSELLSLMTLEARSTDCPDTKFERLERVKIYKFQLEAVRQQHNQDFLMGDQAAAMLQVKDQIARTEMRAAQQNELLERARRSVLETEQVGNSVLQEMHRNRETIESAQRRIGTFSVMTEQASKIIQNMSKPWWRRRR
ncbi:expressed unknown protein [Seminavis robusta]|uniref:Uncharacterized protein n=1 Tax=Seminavis robusta TaxID=568900 RepID=A0A9N8DZX3_9STRA|nr:expressed unknown protein [Seminavis robusta]|eukprot:Sro426_g140370.1 n/a (211) ;mRNA; f:21706-22338